MEARMDATPGSDDAHAWFDADRDGDLLRPGAGPSPRRSPTPLSTTPWRPPAASPVPALDQTFVRAIPIVARTRGAEKARSPADEAEWLTVAAERRAAATRPDPQSFLVLAAAGFVGALFAVTSTMCAAAAGLAAWYVWLV
jgi:hypothetical protein